MGEVTELLLQWNGGDEQARATLVDRLYGELTRIASRFLAGERFGADLQPHALVHEAYLKLVDMNRVEWQSRAHFLAMAARLMRQILVDGSRRRSAYKRDGGVQVTLSDISGEDVPLTTDILMLNEALDRLARVDPDRARLVELRYFGGMTNKETAEVMGLSVATVKRNWEVARGWLFREMNRGER